MSESQADRLERILNGTGSKVSWAGGRYAQRNPELSIETRISTVTFVFDLSDRLIRVETPEDADTSLRPASQIEEDRLKLQEKVRELEDALRLSGEAKTKLELGQVITFRDGTWKVEEFCEEPNTGLVILRSIEPPRPKGIVVPVDWIQELLDRRDVEKVRVCLEEAKKVIMSQHSHACIDRALELLESGRESGKIEETNVIEGGW